MATQIAETRIVVIRTSETLIAVPVQIVVTRILVANVVLQISVPNAVFPISVIRILAPIGVESVVQYVQSSADLEPVYHHHHA